MNVFDPPTGLTQIAHFTMPRVQTWGDSKKDGPYKAWLREAIALPPDLCDQFAWFVFSIRAVVAASRGRRIRNNVDVENIPKLIVDAFTGVLYPDDDIRYVRGVQVEAVFGDDDDECLDVWIFGKPVELEESER